MWIDWSKLPSVSNDRSTHFRDLGIVIFHSENSIGPDGEFTVSGSEGLLAFWGRQGSNPNTSTMPVGLPRIGKQEKGIDMSMAVYLFESNRSRGMTRRGVAVA